MAGMSNCHVDWRTTRSAAHALREISAFVSYRAVVLGFALYALSLCQFSHSWRWKPQCGAQNDHFFFCVSAAATTYNSLPNSRLDICKTLSGVRIHIRQFSPLFCPQLSYFSCHITSYVPESYIHCLCQVCNLIYSPQWLVAQKQRKKQTKMALTMNNFHESVSEFLQHY